MTNEELLKKKKKEEEEKKKKQILIEDGTLSTFGYSNPCEVRE